MRFNFDKYLGAYDAMICKTIDEAMQFQDYLHSVGREWCNGNSYIEEVPDKLEAYVLVEGGAVYCFNTGRYGSYERWRDIYGKGYTAVYYSDFDWDGVVIHGAPDLDELFDLFSGEDKHEDTF